MNRQRLETLLLKGMFAKMLQITVVILRSIVIVPIFLNNWGSEKYGIWIAIYSFFNLMLAIDSGHGQYIGNEFNKSYHRNLPNAKILLGSSLRVAFFSGILQFLIISCLFYFGAFHFIITNSIISSNQIFLCLVLLFTYRILLGSFRGLIMKIINPVGLIRRGFYFNIFEQLLEIIVMLCAIYTQVSILKLCLLFVLQKALTTCIVFFLLKRWMPNLYPWWTKGSIRIGFRNYIMSTALTANSFMRRFANDGINIVLSGLVGVANLPIYYTTKTMVNASQNFTGILTAPVQPELTRLHALKEYSKVAELLKINWLIMGTILNLGFVFAAIFVEYIYTLWTNENLIFNKELYIFLVVALLVFNYGNSYVSYLTSINKLRQLLIINLLRAVNIIFWIFMFVKLIGISGAGLGLLVAEVIAYSWLPDYFVTNYFKEKNVLLSAKVKLYVILPITITLVFHYLFFYSSLNPYLLILLSVSLILFFAILQWQNIQLVVRNRILTLIQSKINFNTSI